MQSDGAVPAAERVPLFTRGFLLVCIGSGSVWLGTQLLLPVLPLYVRSLGGTETAVGLIGGIFVVASLLVRLGTTPIFAVLDPKRLYIGGIATMTLAMALYALAGSLPALLAVRTLHGIGTALATTAGMVIATNLAPAARRTEALAYYSTSANVSMSFAPSLSLALMGVTALPLASYTLVFATGAAITVAALILGSQVPVSTGKSLGGWGALGRPSLGDFFCVRATAIALVFASFAFTYGTLVNFLPLAAADSGNNVGVFFFAHASAVILSRPFSGRLADKVGKRAVAIPAMASIMAGTIVLVVSPSLLTLVAGGVLMGGGIGALWPTLLSLATDIVSPSERTGSLAACLVGYDSGSIVGSIVGGVVAEAAGYGAAFLLAAAIAGLGLVGFFAYSRQLKISRFPD